MKAPALILLLVHLVFSTGAEDDPNLRRKLQYKVERIPNQNPKQIPKKKQTEQQTPEPWVKDMRYNEHDRTVLDFWKASSGEGPRPLVVFIHGGGWGGGDKEYFYRHVQRYLNIGVNCASINYRRLGKPKEATRLPTPVYDVARAIQFLRYKADEWNIEKRNVVLIGDSAGGCTAMFLLNYKDLAEPMSPDPIKRESTRVRGVWAKDGQTSIDPKVIERWIGPGILETPMIYKAVGEKNMDDVINNYQSHAWLYKRFSPINHVSRENPPLYMTYNNNDITRPCLDMMHCIHHGMFGLEMKEKCEILGQECHLDINHISRSDVYNGGHDFVEHMLFGRAVTG